MGLETLVDEGPQVHSVTTRDVLTTAHDAVHA